MDTQAPIEHKHKAIANHSPNQQRMFFAMGSALGHDPEELKEKAKEHFKVGCFQDLTSSQMNYLIDRLVRQQEIRNATPAKKEPEHVELTPEERQKKAESANKETMKKL